MYRVTKTVAFAALALFVSEASAAVTPAIRTSPGNTVPSCVTPDRLMTMITDRNKSLLPKFQPVAEYYKEHGQRLGIRWDYAFFQMIVETNYLRFHRPNGRPGDVDAKQNNFAGLGATGGGVPGDSFPDVSTGVLGHLQHIMMYSGERVDDPVSKRTRDVQNWNLILPWAQAFNRPVTYTDLTTKWSPNDRGYSADIEFLAQRYRAKFCKGGIEELQTAESTKPSTNVADDTTSSAVAASTAATSTSVASAETTPSKDELAQKFANTSRSGLGIALPCKVWTASFGGDKGVLIRSKKDNMVHYTALSVHQERQERELTAYIKAYAQGGEPIEEFRNHDAAVDKAFELCPSK